MQTFTRLFGIVACASLVSGAVSRAQAQQVHGVVRDSGSARPIAGAVVSLVDAGGRASARTLTDEQGRYRLAADATASRVRVLRIGFRPADAPIAANARGDMTIDIAMAPLVTLLDRVSITAESVCPARQDQAQAMALLEQARAGLLATVVARESKPGLLRTVVYERVLDTHTARPVSQVVRTRTGGGARPFLAAQPPSAFADQGFMREDSTGRTFGGPDADVLLHTSFAATHCFQLRAADAEHPGQVGLAFAPAPGRDSLVDVSGVLWIDQATPALRTLDFRYTGLEPAARTAGAGGSLVFRAMPNGVVLIERWSIRTVALARSRATSATRLTMPNGKLRSEQYDVIATAGEVSRPQAERSHIFGSSGITLRVLRMWACT